MDYSFTFTNEEGVSGVFGDPSFDFIVTNVTGMIEAEATVTSSDNAMSDGATFQSSVMKKRNIVLTLRDRPGTDHQANRTTLYRLFRFKSLGTLAITWKGIKREIGYYVEKVTCSQDKRANSYTISLICPNPMYIDPETQTASVGGKTGGFTFPHAFYLAGEAFSVMSTASTVKISNPYAADNIGLTIRFISSGTVVNPYIKDYENDRILQFGTDRRTITIPKGSVLEATTGIGEKQASIIDGSGNKTDVTGYITSASEFLTLSRGDNYFYCGAKNGTGSLTTTISWKFEYEGL